MVRITERSRRFNFTVNVKQEIKDRTYGKKMKKKREKNSDW